MQNACRFIRLLIVLALAMMAMSAVAQDGTDSVPALVTTPYQFVPLPPCRVVDTRLADGTFGGPPIQGGTSASGTSRLDRATAMFPLALPLSH